MHTHDTQGCICAYMLAAQCMCLVQSTFSLSALAGMCVFKKRWGCAVCRPLYTAVFPGWVLLGLCWQLAAGLACAWTHKSTCECANVLLLAAGYSVGVLLYYGVDYVDCVASTVPTHLVGGPPHSCPPSMHLGEGHVSRCVHWGIKKVCLCVHMRIIIILAAATATRLLLSIACLGS